MAKVKKEDFIKQIEEMSVLELNDLVKALEDKFDISSVAPMAAPAAGAGQATDGDEGGEPAEEQTIFNVIVTESGESKLSVIKTLRELNQTLGLKEAKDLVDAAPKEVLSQVDKKTADEAKKRLEEAGAKVELK